MKGESRSARKRAQRALAKAAAKQAEPTTIEPEQPPRVKPKRMSHAAIDAQIQRALMNTTFGRIASVILNDG